MATDKLLKAVISGPADKLDEALRTLVINRQFHPTNASNVLRFLGKVKTPDDPNPYRGQLDTAVSLLSKLGIKPDFRPFDDKNYALGDVAPYLHGLSGACSRIITLKNAAESLIEDNELLIGRLVPFAELNIDISELFAVRRLELRIGRTKPNDFGAVSTFADGNDGVFLFRSGRDEEYYHYIYLVLPKDADSVAEHLENLGFKFAEETDEAGLTGVPAERIQKLRKEAENAKQKADECRAELAEIADREREALLPRYSWLLYMSSAFDLRANAVFKFGKFHITGWLPERESETFKKEAAARGMECLLDKPGLEDRDSIPVKLKGAFLSRIFSPFMEMYGYPAYGEVDPRLFVALTYILMFGIMFGDIGQGAILILFGIWLARKKGAWLGGILASVGCSSVVFGFIYGSVFGNEEWLPGFKVLEGGNIMKILLFSVAIGLVLIVVCMVQNIITGIRQNDPKRAYFSANGVAGGVFFIAVVAGIAAKTMLTVNLFTPAYIVVLIVLPAVALFCGEPLSKLCLRKKDWLPESWGMFFLEGFFDLFETCLSYFSNVVSFLRVGAYSICHTGMMMVVYLLSTKADGGTAVWGVVLGNALVMVIEAVLVFIQVLRLEFYEMFGRYYSGVGSPFSPVRVDYAAAGTHS